MTRHPLNPAGSEKGVALIIVLLLLAVMMGLTTALALNGQTEVAMASNEVTYAGARAAAEAGLNRAVERVIADTSTDLLATGTIPVIGNGPYSLGTQYSYSLQILDDDDPSLYPTALTPAQLVKMGENGDPAVNGNERLILRATGMGPNGTSVTVARVLETVITLHLPGTPTTVVTNPAILVNGNLDMTGNLRVQGARGNVHANGNISGAGSVYVTGDITATGTVSDDLHPLGMKAGAMPPITVPEIKASDYKSLADWILTSTGHRVNRATGATCDSGSGCPTGWTFSAGTSTWSADGAMPSTGTYYVEGNAEVHGTGKSVVTPVSIITEGSLKLTGNGKFTPANTAKIQFVSNGDFELGGTVDADDAVDIDGQIMVREQMKIYGNSEFQGRVMVENRDGATNAYDAISNPNGRKGASTLSANDMTGNMTITYNGHLGDIITTIPGAPGSTPTYTNNISGWIEQ